jgi:hypothetical protein
MPQTSKTTVERKKNTHWERFLCARRLLLIAVPLIAAIYAVAFCVFPWLEPELGCHIAPLVFLWVCYRESD